MCSLKPTGWQVGKGSRFLFAGGGGDEFHPFSMGKIQRSNFLVVIFRQFSVDFSKKKLVGSQFFGKNDDEFF